MIQPVPSRTTMLHGGGSDFSARAFLGRRCGWGAGGHSVSNTGPEGTAPAAASGGPGGRLRRPGGVAGEGRA
jgi:hypothetical protein